MSDQDEKVQTATFIAKKLSEALTQAATWAYEMDGKIDVKGANSFQVGPDWLVYIMYLGNESK